MFECACVVQDQEIDLQNLLVIDLPHQSKMSGTVSQMRQLLDATHMAEVGP